MYKTDQFVPVQMELFLVLPYFYSKVAGKSQRGCFVCTSCKRSVLHLITLQEQAEGDELWRLKRACVKVHLVE